MSTRLAEGKTGGRPASQAGKGKGNRTAKAHASTSVKKSLIPYYVLLTVIVLFVGGIRFRLREMPLERDEGEYAYAGQLLLQGIPPYQLAYNMKLPGTYEAYAALMAIFGETIAGIHVGLLLVNAATIVLIFFFVRRVLDPTAAIVAAASYAILSTSPTVLGLAGHATHFVVLAAVAGILFLVDAISGPKPWKFLCAGILLGLSFLMKQPGIFFVLFGAIWLVISAWQRKIGWRVSAARFLLFASGTVMPFALTCLWLWRARVFHRFWFWTFAYARQYGSQISLREAPGVFWTQAPNVIRPALPLWLLAAAGLVVLVWKRRNSEAVLFASAFFLCSFLAVCPGFYFREHYFILVLPAVALLAGAAVSISANEFTRRENLKFRRFIPMLVFAASFGYALWQQSEFLFEMDPVTACRAEYGPNPFPEAIPIADYLKAHSSPTSTVAILGSEPEIYFYAHRHSATGYIYTYPLMEDQPYAAKMQQEMISEIERARPQYIVFVNVPVSWLGRPTSSRLILDWSQQYLSQNYEIDGLADILDESQYRWGEEAATYQAASPYTVRIFKRTNGSAQ